MDVRGYINVVGEGAGGLTNSTCHINPLGLVGWCLCDLDTLPSVIIEVS